MWQVPASETLSVKVWDYDSLRWAPYVSNGALLVLLLDWWGRIAPPLWPLELLHPEPPLGTGQVAMCLLSCLLLPAVCVAGRSSDELLGCVDIPLREAQEVGWE